MTKPLLAPLAAAALVLPFVAPASAQQAAPAAPAARAAVPPELPLRDFFRSPARSGYNLSDGGRWVSFLQPAAGEAGAAPRRNVFVQKLVDGRAVGEPRQLTRETARDIRMYAWKGDDTVLFMKDFGGDENFHVVAADAATGKVRDLTPWEGVRAELVDNLPEDPGHVLVMHNRRDRKAFDVVRLDVRSGAETVVATNPGNIVNWVTDHRGRIRVAIASDGVNNTVLYRDGDSGEFKPLLTTDFRTAVQPLFFDGDNRLFYAVSNRGRDKSALVLIDPAKPDAEQVVYGHPEVDVEGAHWSRVQKKVLWASYETDKHGKQFFDPAMQATYEKLQQQFPGEQVDLTAWTLDEKRYIVVNWSDRTLGARSLYDVRSGKLTKLADAAPWIKPEQMAEMKPVRYTARDGLSIPAYLTLPAGREPKNLACVVNPHGGPWARDSWGFNPEVQFLANRGYCVLQMNFRGSTGFGRQFWEASFGQWGLKMQDDISDGAKWLVEQGIADPKRIGLYGGSYGGYATLAGVTFTPDLYAAAVDYVGVSNLFTFMKTIPPYWEPWRQQMYAMVGNPDDAKDKERLTATSPVFHVDRIKTPLLVAQGARDPRVNKAESDQIVEALKKRGVEVEYLVKDNEGHGFANEENKFEFYGAMEKFFAKHLK
ncbi:alpha/beta hydrolase family protein [Rubrivivax gelatinosus]|uniref:alpha/beta hydrolase family protein n=1 Tax=Rubrivivax gelatinosus TaxID=28068 RepID=UPI0002FDD626|nr:S9 family peptidase [Rubrivivax gelatinosus]MBG6081410.1 dipeptidyl aminopeptidase/acylaminoacyl peptidase [Rubrivivax gelatinosus]